MLDKNILEDLFRQHYGKMMHLACALLGDNEEAEDVVQDVFAQLLEKDFPMAPDKCESYLLTATRHGCLNIIRHKRVQEKVQHLYPVEEEDLHEDVKDRMTVTHDSSTGGIRLGGYAQAGEVPSNK